MLHLYFGDHRSRARTTQRAAKRCSTVKNAQTCTLQMQYVTVSMSNDRSETGFELGGENWSTVGSIMKKWTNIAASITRVLDVGLKKSNIQYTQDNLLGVLG
jgi:hypothetical protein